MHASNPFTTVRSGVKLKDFASGLHNSNLLTSRLRSKPNLPIKKTFVKFYQQHNLTSTIDIWRTCRQAKYWKGAAPPSLPYSYTTGIQLSITLLANSACALLTCTASYFVFKAGKFNKLIRLSLLVISPFRRHMGSTGCWILLPRVIR